jgi:hypothetical protein
MASLKPPVVLTANDLCSGEVVYWSSQAGWQGVIECAEVYTDLAVAESCLKAQDDPLKVVGPYLAGVRIENGSAVPEHYRESFRKAGPTNYFHGKQASL